MAKRQGYKPDGCVAFTDEGRDVGGEDRTSTAGTERAKSISAPITGSANLKLITDPEADEHPDIRAAIDKAVQTTMTAHGTVSFIDGLPFPVVSGMPENRFPLRQRCELPLMRGRPVIR